MNTREPAPLLGDILDAVDSALLVLAPDGTCVLANPRAAELLGRPVEQLLDVPLTDSVRFTDASGNVLAEGQSLWAQALESGTRKAGRLRVVDDEGRRRDFRATASPLGEPGVHGVVLALREGATVRRLARWAAMLMDEMPVAAVLADADGAVRYANPRSDHFWRRPVVQGGPERWYEDFPMWDAEGELLTREQRPLVRALRGETTRDMMVTVERADAVRELALVSATPIRDDDGCIIAAVSFIADVTEPEMDRRLSAALAEITAMVDSAAEPEEVLPQAMEAAALAMGATGALLLERSSEEWRVVTGYGVAKDAPGVGFPLDRLPVANRAEESGDPAAWSESDGESSAIAYWTPDHPVRAALAIPLDVHGAPVCVLELVFSNPTQFTGAHLEFAKRLSRAVALARANAMLVQSLRDELAHSTLLQEVAIVSTSSPDLRVVCTRVLKALARHIGMRAGDIRVVSADGRVLRLVASHGYPEEMLSRIEEMPTTGGESMAQRAFAGDRVLTHLDEVPEREHMMLAASDEHGGMRYITMPVEFRKRRTGVLSLVFPGSRAFRDDEIGLFHAVAHTIGQAIEAARLLEAEREARSEATSELEISNLLLDAAERLSRPLELEGVCDTLAEVLEGLTGRSRIIVALYQTRQNRMVVAALRNVRQTRRGESMSFEGLPGEFLAALADGRPRIVRPTSKQLPPEQRRRAEATESRIGLFIPLHAHDRLLGLVSIDEPNVDREFTEREIRLVESVASQAAVLIENARVYEGEHRIAETLQETLLLMPQRVTGVRFGTLYRSATAAARVGGDFYDLFEIGDGRVALVVGDVSGKGLDAASVTALARNAVRIHAHEGAPPSEVMRRTNDVLRRFTSAETFVTAFFGVLDTRSGALTYVSAGHPEGMIVGRGGYVRTLTGESPLLGALEDVEFEERTTMVAPTDTVFAYTDGVTEARRGAEFFGTERLAEFLGTLRDNDPKTLPQKVFASIDSFAEGRLRDDVAMLAVRRDAGEDGA